MLSSLVIFLELDLELFTGIQTAILERERRRVRVSINYSKLI